MVVLLVISSIITFLIYFFLQLKASENVFHNLWFHFGNSLGIGPVFIYTVFLSIKMMKQFSQKINEKKEIEQAKLNTEIQLLRAQVHPHFLFNTLNNIYSFTLENSPHANELVSKLSDTLFYMVNSCDAELVPLEKEIKMIMDYIDLEKVRYGDRLDIQIDLQGETSDKLIAPLLMIPLVENAFKHGASKMLLNPPWLKLKICNTEDMLFFELTNAITCLPLKTSGANSGIGLRNVRKRLELLYPGRHELAIHSLKEMFFVRIKVPLINKHETNEELNFLTHFPANKSFSYV
jgi:LytS/YehU family sensor histidine kinase